VGFFVAPSSIRISTFSCPDRRCWEYPIISLEGDAIMTVATDPVVSNQEKILANQSRILGNQDTILANQKKFETVLVNQKKLDTIVANQERILANQEKILAK